MATTINLYNSGVESLLGLTDVTSDTLIATLHGVDGGFVRAQRSWSEISGTEITDSGYAGIALTGVTVSTTSNVLKIDCNNIAFGGAYTAYHMIIRDSTNDRLLIHVDFDGEQVGSTAFTYVVDSNGLVRMGTNGFS